MNEEMIPTSQFKLDEFAKDLSPKNYEREGEKAGIVDVVLSYAMARMEVEQSIGSTDPSQWTDLGMEVLNRYPALDIYRDVFLAGIERLQRSHNLVENAWSKVVGEDDSVIAEDGQAKLLGLEKSKRLLDSIYHWGRNTGKMQVRAEKGLFTLTFFCDEVPFEENGKGPGSAQGASTVERGMRVLFVQVPDINDVDLTDPETGKILYHEAKHARNAAFKNGYINKLWDLKEDLSQEPDFIDLYARAYESMSYKNIDEKRSPEDYFKSEFSAHFYEYFVNYEGKYLAENKMLSHDKMRELVEVLVSGVCIRTAENYKGLPSNEAFFDKLDRDEIVNSVVDFKHLLVDEKLIDPITADEIVMSTLEMFPVKSWGTVSRLIQSKSKKSSD